MRPTRSFNVLDPLNWVFVYDSCIDFIRLWVVGKPNALKLLLEVG